MISPRLLFQQRHREQHRQLGRCRTLDSLTEGELIEKQAVLRGELTVLDLVLHGHRQLAPVDRVARVFDRVRRQARQLDVLGARGDVEKELLGQRIPLATQVERAVAVDAAAHHHVRRRGVVGSDRRNRTLKLREIGRVVGLDEVVGEVHGAVGERDLTDANDRFRAVVTRLLRNDRHHASGRLGSDDGSPSRRARWRRAALLGIRSRDRLLFPGRGEHVLQVQPPVGVDDHARVKIGPCDVVQAQRQRRVLRRDLQVNLAELEFFPAHEIVRGDLVLRREVRHLGRARECEVGSRGARRTAARRFVGKG